MINGDRIDTTYLFRQIQPNRSMGKINDQELVKGSDHRNKLPSEINKRVRFVKAVLNAVAFKYITPQAAKSLEDIKPLVLGDNSLGRMIVDYTSNSLRLVDACRIAYATENDKAVRTKSNRPLDLNRFSHINPMEKQMLGLLVRNRYDPTMIGKLTSNGDIKISDKRVLTPREQEGRKRLVDELMRRTANKELNSYEFLSLSGIKGLVFNNVSHEGSHKYYIEGLFSKDMSLVDAYRIMRVFNEGIQAPRSTNHVWV